MRTFAKIFIVIGIVLSGVNITGISLVNDKRKDLDVSLSYAAALEAMDQTYAEYGSSSESIERLAQIYADSIHYSWPTEWAQVPLTDNWILHFLGYTDAAFVWLGLSQVENLFSEFQSLNYERGFRRGYGICSQNAIAFVDLVERRYGMQGAVVALGGHVVAEVETPAGGVLADPSLGIFLPMGSDDLGETVPPSVYQAYAATNTEIMFL